MVKTEDTYLSMIEDQSSNSDIITIADLARADAFNLFVVSLRANWESYRNTTDNTIILRRADMDLNWDSFVNKVANDYFFERRFSQFFAQTLLNKLKYTPSVIGYDIKVDTSGNGSGVGNNYTSDENALATIVESMFVEGGKKIDVVDCNQDSLTNCNGSFYLTFNTIPLSDANYELLPTITVKRQKNNEIMQRPVLARQYYKIYMPWRGFQAMRVARRIAESPVREMDASPVEFDASLDYGLFNPILHNTLEQARLGVCDPGTCGPRTDFFKTSDQSGFDQQCNVPFPVNGVAASQKPVGSNYLINTPAVTYSIGDTQDKFQALFVSLVKDTVKNNLSGRENFENITFTQSLEMTADTPDYTGINPSRPIVVEDINAFINGDGTITKEVTMSGNPAPLIPSIVPVVFDPSLSDSVADKAGGLGIFYDSINQKSVYPSEIQYPFGGYYNANRNLRCFELGSEGIQLNLVFKETNPKYSISNNEPKTYIKLVDAYTEFTFPSDTSLNSSLNSFNGYIEPYPPTNISPNNVKDLWKCDSYGDPSNQSGPACVSP